MPSPSLVMSRASVVAAALAVLLIAAAAPAAAQDAPAGRMFAADGCRERVPDKPDNLRGRAVNESAITVTWRAPAGDACVDSYDYVVLEAGKPEPRTLSWFNKKSYSFTVTNLKPATDYVVKVAAVNSQRGRGQYATINVATRRERCGLFANRRPGPVSDVSFTQTAPTTAFISWLPPSEGCTSWYRVDAFDPSGRRLSRRVAWDADTYVTVRPNSRYIYQITPISLFGGEGPSTQATLSTSSAGPRVG